MKRRKKQFTDTWRFVYWYPSNEHEGEDSSEYMVRALQIGEQLVLESLPNDEGSYMFVRLTVEGDLATGTWYETTSPDGAFKGMTYSGAGQLIITPDGRRMRGQWAGVGIDHTAKKRKIYTGRWELTEANQTPKAGHAGSVDFSGIWLSRFSHSNAVHKGAVSLHYVTMQQKDGQLMVGGVPSVNNSSIVLRLSLEDLIATGTWQEYSASAGSTRYGSVQFLVDPIKKRLVGKWVGFGDANEVVTGQWEIIHAGNRLPEQASDSK